MKKILLTFVLVFAVSFAHANNDNDKKNNVKTEKKDTFVTVKKKTTLKYYSAIEIQPISSEEDVVRCRWRTCTYVNGVRQGCGEWTYGYCNKDSSGKLTKLEADN